MAGRVLTAYWSDGTSFDLPILWLRDNCPCDQCRVPQTTEKQFQLVNECAELQPNAVYVSDDVLQVTWPDDHVTTMSRQLIESFSDASHVQWRAWADDFAPSRIGFDGFLNEDQVALDAIAAYLRDGVILIEAAPVESHTVEALAKRLGPIRETAFSRVHDVIVDTEGYNVAHTALALPPHNDLCSMSWPPSIQVLHMLENEVEGGDSIIVDGFAIAEHMRENSPGYFQTLSQVDVPFRIFDAEFETFTRKPLFGLDQHGELQITRYSNQTMQPMDPLAPETATFYEAYYELSEHVMSDAFRHTFRLQPGMMLVVHGHRVLHGRQAFEPTGRRRLQDAYFEHDNLKNHATVIKSRASG